MKHNFIKKNIYLLIIASWIVQKREKEIKDCLSFKSYSPGLALLMRVSLKILFKAIYSNELPLIIMVNVYDMNKHKELKML